MLIEGRSAEAIDLAGAAGHAGAGYRRVCYLGDNGRGRAATGAVRMMRVTKTHDYDLVGI